MNDIQSLAVFFGWDREKALKVKQSASEIAPNGTRRERRINNDYIPDDENPILLLQREIKRENKIENIIKNNNQHTTI